MVGMCVFLTRCVCFGAMMIGIICWLHCAWWKRNTYLHCLSTSVTPYHVPGGNILTLAATSYTGDLCPQRHHICTCACTCMCVWLVFTPVHAWSYIVLSNANSRGVPSRRRRGSHKLSPGVSEMTLNSWTLSLSSASWRYIEKHHPRLLSSRRPTTLSTIQWKWAKGDFWVFTEVKSNQVCTFVCTQYSSTEG